MEFSLVFVFQVVLFVEHTQRVANEEGDAEEVKHTLVIIQRFTLHPDDRESPRARQAVRSTYSPLETWSCERGSFEIIPVARVYSRFLPARIEINQIPCFVVLELIRKLQ